MLRSIAKRLADDGHDVTVLTGQPSYGPDSKHLRRPRVEYIDGFTVRRAWLFPESKRNFVVRGVDLVLFMLRVAMRIIFSRPSYAALMAATTPPVMVAWAAALAAKARGSCFVYHCQDIHPELLKYAGLLDREFVYRFLQRRDSSTVARAARVVVLSSDMRNTLAARAGNGGSHVRVINNFTAPTFCSASAALPVVDGAKKRPGTFRVLFAGNLGYFQNLDR